MRINVRGLCQYHNHSEKTFMLRIFFCFALGYFFFTYENYLSLQTVLYLREFSWLGGLLNDQKKNHNYIICSEFHLSLL